MSKYMNVFSCENCETHFFRDTDVSWDTQQCPSCKRMVTAYHSEENKPDKYWDDEGGIHWAM